jgi:hypothetical protein
MAWSVSLLWVAVSKTGIHCGCREAWLILKDMKTVFAFLERRLGSIAWVLSVLVVAAAVIAWGQTNDWKFFGSSLYRLFPIFGLLAFSLFWVQYVVAGLSMLIPARAPGITQFFKVTNILVLLAILLHPGLLSYQLWRDGFGLPPMSILKVMPGVEWIVVLGMISWVIFMSYLVTVKQHRYFRTKKWWVWFGYAGEVGMLAVFYHGFRLGDQLQSGWFKGLWFVYGIILVGAFACLHRDKLTALFHPGAKKSSEADT